ncbi:MAG TPA: carboxypeptidase-like regulatory domain-containing protein [Candidatus Thermoplasmatota archaeon]|nr:carboxypeptidase-like regulatory domain-containing protein [Candidatus Thermoplasmatota archaeon]
MRGPPLPLALAFVAALLAGCTQGSPGEDLPPADFDDLELEATATTGVIRGIVVDDAIRPIAGANVLLTPGDKTATSTDAGTFGFDALEPGTYFLKVERAGYNATQTSAEVVAGVAEPPIVKVLLSPNPSTVPYVETLQFNGFLSLGAAIGITSVGTTINPTLSEALDDTSIWTVEFAEVPAWAQGELVWTHNQAAGGMLIWEMVVGGTNDFKGYRETEVSPALAYWNTTTLEAEAGNVTDPEHGIAYRFFGGPHPLLAPGEGVIPPRDQCPTVPTVVLGNRNPCSFGYGLTIQQRADAYIHHFYNFAPPEGWRFTVDGDPVIPSPA